ncbi:unnamed protein product [Rangifer tarandus platyrhynchus]|uniref:Uncharacterized protein n=1 Tax=Rangifer tarandus platyrhynchus TaxID=3082113 RepID=A0AC59YZX1_RANTA
MAWLRMRRRCREVRAGTGDVRLRASWCHRGGRGRTGEVETCSHFKHGVYPSSIPLPSAPLGGALLSFAGLVRCFLHQEALPDALWGNVALSSGPWLQLEHLGWTNQLEPPVYSLITSHLPGHSVFPSLSPGSLLITPAACPAEDLARPAAGSRLAACPAAAGLPRHVPRAPWGRVTSWEASARALSPRARLRPPVVSGKGVRRAAGRWGGRRRERAAAGRGRCPFKVPPPRGRETACASPIPPGSARDKKHNA